MPDQAATFTPNRSGIFNFVAGNNAARYIDKSVNQRKSNRAIIPVENKNGKLSGFSEDAHLQ
jgi:hypothetical protein